MHTHARAPTHTHRCNAVVAVLSYTGYDMEDACIINKSSYARAHAHASFRCSVYALRRYERGFGHASVYVTKYFDLEDDHHLKGGQWRCVRVCVCVRV